jgi:hypothetical protein
MGGEPPFAAARTNGGNAPKLRRCYSHTSVVLGGITDIAREATFNGIPDCQNARPEVASACMFVLPTPLLSSHEIWGPSQGSWRCLRSPAQSGVIDRFHVVSSAYPYCRTPPHVTRAVAAPSKTSVSMTRMPIWPPPTSVIAFRLVFTPRAEIAVTSIQRDVSEAASAAAPGIKPTLLAATRAAKATTTHGIVGRTPSVGRERRQTMTIKRTTGNRATGTVRANRLEAGRAAA